MSFLFSEIRIQGDNVLENREKLLIQATKATMRLSSDWPATRARRDFLYLHGLSEGMCTGHDIFGTVVRILESGMVSRIAVAGGDGGGMPPRDKPGDAWPGEAWYREELLKRGIPETIMVGTRQGRHTRGEADCLVALAEERGWKSGLVLSAAYHSVRAMSCHVAAMHAQGHMMDLRFVATQQADWHQEMLGSQSEETTTSARELDVEVASILKYWERGANNDAWKDAWGAPPAMLFEYLDTIRPGLSS